MSLLSGWQSLVSTSSVTSNLHILQENYQTYLNGRPRAVTATLEWAVRVIKAPHISVQIPRRWLTKASTDYRCSRFAKHDGFPLSSFNMTRNVYVDRPNTEARSRNHCCRDKAISSSSTLSAWLCSLNHPTRKAHALLPSVACLALPDFYTLCHKCQHPEKVLKIKHVVLSFSTTFVRNIFHSKKNSARYHKWKQVFMWSSRYACQILNKPELPQQIFEKKYTQIQNFMKIRPVISMRTDGQARGS